MIKRLIIMIVVGLCLFGIWELGRQANRWGSPDALRAIKAEKIIDRRLLGMELDYTYERGRNGPMTKTVSPSIENVFKANDRNVDETIKQIIEYAKSDGWVYDEEFSSQDTWSALKRVRKDITLDMYVKESANKGNIIIEVSSYDENYK